MTGRRLEGKRTIVTGAGQGIGEAIARAFASEGARVVLAERNATTGLRVAESIGASARFIVADVTDARSVSEMTAEATFWMGGVDVLVNNAGANVFHSPLEMPDDAWDRCFRLDLEAAWLCSRAVSR